MSGFGMGIGMWIFWIVLVVVVIFLVNNFLGGSSGRSVTSSESPLDILQRRYASGEIDKDEFESMKKRLEK